MPKSKIKFDRLRWGIQAIRYNPDRFNPAVWISPDRSEMCFAGFIVEEYGTEKQWREYTWERGHDWVGSKLLGIDSNQNRSLFWGGHTIDSIEKLVNEWENPTRKSRKKRKTTKGGE